jgi:hypothetical protein
VLQCVIKGNGGDGLKCSNGGKFRLIESIVERNRGYGVNMSAGSRGEILKCHFADNNGVIHKDTGCSTTCSSNTAIAAVPSSKTIPGFRLITTTALADASTTKPKTNPEPVKSSG